MGLVANYIKRKINTWLSPEFWTYQKVLFYYLIKRPNRSFRIRLNGKSIVANDAKALLGMYREIFLQKQYHFQSTEQQPFIIDCGANIGIATLYYKRIFPNAKLICIEADPTIAEQLKNNIKRNHLNDVTVVAKAAWVNNDEKLQFSVYGADAGSLFGDGEKIEVSTMRLRDFIDAQDKIDMLKMDIEGAEIDVLKDCEPVLGKVKQAFVEFHSFPGKPQALEDLLAVLSRSGFRYFILPVRRIDSPFTFNFSKEQMDLQLNIFAYRP